MLLEVHFAHDKSSVGKTSLKSSSKFCGAGKIHARARNRVETRREGGAESQSVGGFKFMY